MFLITIGALDTGFEFIGPFNFELDARNWANQHLSNKPYGFDVLKLRHPDYAAKHISDLPKGE